MWKEAAICRGRCLVTRSDRVAGRLREAAGTGDESSTYTLHLHLLPLAYTYSTAHYYTHKDRVKTDEIGKLLL